MKTSGGFQLRVAIITGAGRSIGRATALAFAQKGIAVAIASRADHRCSLRACPKRSRT